MVVVLSTYHEERMVDLGIEEICEPGEQERLAFTSRCQFAMTCVSNVSLDCIRFTLHT